MEDIQIIDLYWARNQEAVRETAEKYGGFLSRMAGNFLRNPDDAEECVNDTYLKAWNAIPPARPESFRTWLGRVIRNLALDRWKREHAEKRGGDSFEILLGELDACIPTCYGPEKTLEDQEIANIINAFLRTLNPETRWIFLHRYWYGERLSEIAEKLDCGEGKLKSLLFRTRKKLKIYLEREGIFL